MKETDRTTAGQASSSTSQRLGFARSSAIDDGRQSVAAADICRGVVRLLAAHNMAAIGEVVLANGRRADVMGLGAGGEIWIVEIKSCLDDFRTDQKWPEYRPFCDRLFFAVGPSFPHDVLPEEAGMIVADRYGGEILRMPGEHKLPTVRRKQLILQLARLGAARLQSVIDPDAKLETLL